MMMRRLKSTVLLVLSSLLLVSCAPYIPSQWEIEQTTLEFKHQPAEAIFKKASEEYQGRAYNLAIMQYSALIKLYPTHQYAELASMALVYRCNGNLAQAIKTADKFIARYPNSQYRRKVKAIKRDLKAKQRSINNYDMFGLYPYWGSFTPYSYILASVTILPILPPILLVRFLFFV